MSTPKLRTLVIDDSALYRKFIAAVLAEIPSIEVVGTASNGRIGLEKIQLLQPDLVTLDQEMPELDGLGLLQVLSNGDSQVATIMVSSATDTGARTTNAALRWGAFDFVLKPTGMGPEEAHLQLKTELTPKIQAFIANRQRAASLSIHGDSPESSDSNFALDKMVREIGSKRQIPQIVGIGVSTGGPAALNQLLPNLPGDFPCPIVLVQHMPPKFTRSLAEDLDRICALNVREASDGDLVKAGEVLVAPGGTQMRIALSANQPIIQITDDPPERSCKPAVDYLFRSIAHCYGDRSLGVVLTGMGDDGTLGCKLLKRTGAMILSQDEATCVVYGMPRSVFEAGLSDQVAPLGEISACLLAAVGRGATV